MSHLLMVPTELGANGGDAPADFLQHLPLFVGLCGVLPHQLEVTHVPADLKSGIEQLKKAVLNPDKTKALDVRYFQTIMVSVVVLIKRKGGK